MSNLKAFKIHRYDYRKQNCKNPNEISPTISGKNRKVCTPHTNSHTASVPL